MNSMTKKRKGLDDCIGKRDRLSELPDEVLVHILSFLPTVDVVRTMLLRRFGNLWTMVPNLSFDDSDWETSIDLISHLLQFVCNVLIFHKRPSIEKFSLQMREDNWDMAGNVASVNALNSAIKVWINFALSREAKELILDFDHRGPSHWPPAFFTSQSLVRLELNRCRIRFPSQVSMGSLRNLALRWVVVKGGDLNDFISDCPSLQELVLREVKDCYNLSSPSIEKLVLCEENPSTTWTINFPSLKILDVFVYLRAVEAIQFPCVHELTIGSAYDHDSGTKQGPHQLKRFLEGLQNVEVLTLEQYAVLQFTNWLRVNVGFPRNRWKCVVLKSPIQDTNIAGICSLVKNSPCLEKLIIHVDNYDRYEEFLLTGDSNLVSQEASCPCLAPNLKLVSIHGHGKPYEVQLGLVKFLLKSAVNLEKLVISPSRKSQLTSAEESLFVKQLSTFSRTSEKARIVFE